MESAYLYANGIRLHYVRQGTGPLILFLHGFPECWYSWRHQLAAFGQDFSAIALDLRGYNKSDKPQAQSAYSLEILVEDVKETIRALGYERCTLVGHDWGGAIAWSFAYAYPDWLDRLIVLNLPHPAKFREGLQSPQQLLKSWYVGFFQLPILPELLLKANNYAAIRAIFERQAINPNTFSAADLDSLIAAVAQPGALTSMLNYYRNIFQPHSLLTRTWGVLQVPTLMIWGENDVALGKELTEGTEQYVSNFSIQYIPHCSHWVQQEQPERVNRYIIDFLGQHF
jgi:epoxide hydrolase 4